MTRGFLLCLVLIAVLAYSAAAGDGLAAAFGGGRAPRPGEWMEYLVAFPVDPLENSLRPDPAAPPRNGDREPGVDDWAFIEPVFEPEIAWRVLPLRLETREVDAEGFNAVLTFGGATRRVRILFADGEPRAEFHYEDPQPQPAVETVRLGEDEIRVETVRRRAERHGFARQSNSELPFGLFRFASEDLDLVLVAAGWGRPPDFPARSPAPVDPPPGMFYVEDTL